MSKHSPFPWTIERNSRGEFVFSGNYCIHQTAYSPTGEGDTRLIAAIPEVLRAAIHGHGWGDPLHQQHDPECTMCKAIRQAIGPLTRERVLELARWDADEVCRILARADDDAWDEVYVHLGISPDDSNPETKRLSEAGEYEAIELDILDAIGTPHEDRIQSHNR